MMSRKCRSMLNQKARVWPLYRRTNVVKLSDWWARCA